MPHHPSVQDLLDFFRFEHLPPHLASVSEAFSWLAHRIVEPGQVGEDDSGEPIGRRGAPLVALVDAAALRRAELGFGLTGPEATVALRKLLEAKDCAVRAAVQKAART